jgi:hypothetical protein
MKLTRMTKILALVPIAGLTLTGPVMAEGRPSPNDPIVLLLKGIYQPVVKAPTLGLGPGTAIDNTWTFTEIYSVTSVPSINNQDHAVIGHFYSPATGPYVEYDLPGGSILMQFTAGSGPNMGWGDPISDGNGGFYYQETWDLNIVAATGIYSSYVGGHNHMVDRFHSLNGDFLKHPAAGPFDEDCYCIISAPSEPGLWWTSN